MKQGPGSRVQGPACLALLAVFVMLSASAQTITLGEARPVTQHVVLLSDAAEVQAGAAQTVELRFRVDAGFHINSHAPKDETLIPTVLKLDAANGVRVEDTAYPAGVPYVLKGSGETLDTYQSEFRVRVRMVVPKGDTVLSGMLRYQACDNASCFPPRMLPVKMLITAK